MILKKLVSAIAVAGSAIVVARSVFKLPKIEERIDSTALPKAMSGPLAKALIELEAKYKGLTGIAPLQNGADAFAARMLLADAAVSSIDAQYYMWHADLTGILLLDALVRAADRGVRVRLLLDDNGTSGLDAEMAALVAHPNIEVRLYNPFNLRTFKTLSYAFDFFRLNRRMHNKSFTVDGRATILGGRNVGDEYFGTGSTPLFVDLDVLAVGMIVAEVAADFDRYWGSQSSYPAETIVGINKNTDPIAKRLASFKDDPQMRKYKAILANSNSVSALTKGELDLEWTTALLVSDDPAKGMGIVPEKELLASRLKAALGDIQDQFDGISAYLVPGTAGVKTFADLQASGVSVRMLTNSMEATDVLPVHAGYARYRKKMLKSGVGLFELRDKVAPSAAASRLGLLGSTGASLHTKTFAVDGRRIFVGSFNFDPRSTTLNTELGLLIDSEPMAQQLHSVFDEGMVGLTWRVKLHGNKLVWIDANTDLVMTSEPGSSALRSLIMMIVGWLPVEWLL